MLLDNQCPGGLYFWLHAVKGSSAADTLTASYLFLAHMP
jgi:hypothetical protein